MNVRDAIIFVVLLHCGGGAQRQTTPDSKASAKPVAKMVHFGVGDFMMGAPEGQGDKYERPQHSVHVDAFDLDVTELTVSAYAECVKAAACPPAPDTIEGSNYTDDDKNTWRRCR